MDGVVDMDEGRDGRFVIFFKMGAGGRGVVGRKD